MSSSHTPDDVERQAVQESQKETLSVSDSKRSTTIPFIGPYSDIPSRDGECIPDRTAQCCFLCLRGKKSGQYAVRLHCLRPTKWRRVTRRCQLFNKSGVMQSEKKTYEKLDPKENSCESDTAIYQRLNDACFQYQSKWKNWIPFYGVVDVHEVEFRFLGDPDGAGPIPIHIYPVNIDEIWRKTDQTIALEPDYNFSDRCDRGWHSQDCETMMDTFDRPCVNDQILTARQRRNKLDTLYLLKDCARNPWKANGLRTLEGMAQESCIYNTKQVIVPGCQQFDDRIDKLRGIEFVMGWQMDRIICEMPVKIAWIWFSIAITWFCVIVWGGSAGDWATAMAFGQLLAAFISLIYFSAKD